jgi:hypothetical protein
VTVETQEEAKLLAALSTEYERLFSDTPERPDAALCRRIIEVSRRYRYTSFAFRRLEAWLSQTADDHQAGNE